MPAMVKQLLEHRAPRVRRPQIQHEQRDHDREDTIAERLDAPALGEHLRMSVAVGCRAVRRARCLERHFAHVLRPSSRGGGRIAGTGPGLARRP
jgi:hypothetical protein